MYTYIHACIHTYIHTYIYIHIHIYTYIYTHTYAHTSQPPGRRSRGGSRSPSSGCRPGAPGRPSHLLYCCFYFVCLLFLFKFVFIVCLCYYSLLTISLFLLLNSDTSLLLIYLKLFFVQGVPRTFSFVVYFIRFKVFKYCFFSLSLSLCIYIYVYIYIYIYTCFRASLAPFCCCLFFCCRLNSNTSFQVFILGSFCSRASLAPFSSLARSWLVLYSM